MNVNVEPTVEAIEAMASKLREDAADLDRIACKMKIRQDLTYASEAINCISNGIMNLRLDLLVTRPIRELSRSK